MSKWIKAADKIPEMHEDVFEGEPYLVSDPVLVAYNNGEYLVCVYEKDGSADNGPAEFEGWVSVFDSFIPTTVTHWMPLPDPPEEGEGS